MRASALCCWLLASTSRPRWQPGPPRELGGYDTPGIAHDVALSGTLAYVADGSGGLVILERLPSVYLPLALRGSTSPPRELPPYDDGNHELPLGGRQHSFMAVRYAVSPAVRVHSARFYLGGEMRPVRFAVWDGDWNELYAQTLLPARAAGTFRPNP